MRVAHRVDVVRAAEAALISRSPDGALMRRAAAGLAAVCADVLGGNGQRLYGARVVVLTGSGDNGGDALYAAARLARRGAATTAVLLNPDRAHAAALADLRAAGGRTATPQEGPALLARADLVLDGIIGMGGKGGLRPDAVPLAAAARDSRAAVIAVDLPSGVDADTGEVTGDAVHADVTVTFGTYKPGLLIDPAASLVGVPRLIDIGLAADLGPPELEALQHADVAALLPGPSGESDKYRRGVVGVVAGSERYPGAAVLAVSGALRGGAGAVRYVGRGGDAVLARHPETLVSTGSPADAGRVQAWVVGPGLGDSAEARSAVAQVLESDVPVLVDADGLRLLTPEAVRGRSAPTVLTPHAGEAAALLGRAREDVEARRLAAVRELAETFGATVLLKGSTTLIAGAGPARVNPTGTAWLATAGSGDVLSGLTGSLLATGLPPRDAASVAAYLHGLAARRAAGHPGAPIAALDVAEAVPAAWRDVHSS
jgi:hydroxyethylthiazole kinase-like uncharacterized protein yjeF